MSGVLSKGENRYFEGKICLWNEPEICLIFKWDFEAEFSLQSFTNFPPTLIYYLSFSLIFCHFILWHLLLSDFWVFVRGSNVVFPFYLAKASCCLQPDLRVCHL